ncbi:LytTR family DNA-binding domain-containing protein [Flavihumibacter rivuli]|uniref:LytR/AlgR family response regulator transcription factor n=1 Tax=Flavihumibacter rivuli TaxID=2838156 RepID=UPI001BDDD83D|nr:LytTR family DNA-binding domain-containing protein [Flavihumibacter rivuli]ULQ56958.1 LytTR family DNA-binding domain-containing protein [Flavihumibacter rivuli]
MQRVIIIDDERDARLMIRQYLEAHPEFEILEECENGAEAIEKVNRLEPDVIFLDIQMPVFSGFQVIQQLIHVPQIIFTTAYDQYAIKAFDTNAVDYLLKPYTRERFDNAVSRLKVRNAARFEAALSAADAVLQEKDQQVGNTILIESGSKLVSLQLRDVIFMEAEKDYTRLHTAGKSYLSNYRISQLEERLPRDQFIRVHRSYIINISHIKEVHRDANSAQLITSNGQVLNISRTYMPQLKKLMF